MAVIGWVVLKFATFGSLGKYISWSSLLVRFPVERTFVEVGGQLSSPSVLIYDCICICISVCVILWWWLFEGSFGVSEFSSCAASPSLNTSNVTAASGKHSDSTSEANFSDKCGKKDADKIQPKIPIGGRGVSGPQLSDFSLHFPDFHYLSLIIFELLSDHFWLLQEL